MPAWVTETRSADKQWTLMEEGRGSRRREEGRGGRTREEET
jgi:hypothetical protein